MTGRINRDYFSSQRYRACQRTCLLSLFHHRRGGAYAEYTLRRNVERPVAKNLCCQRVLKNMSI